LSSTFYEFVRRELGRVIYLVPTLAVAQGLPDEAPIAARSVCPSVDE
jgi:hypothetical protein